MNRQQIIETLILWNFWEKDINVGIPRDLYLARIRKYLSLDEIIVLTGIRRSGKSTILLQVLSELIKDKVPRINTLYINFEDPKFYNLLTVDLLDDIWQSYLDYLKPKGMVYLVLDEVQKIKGWENWVRAKYDRKEKVKIFVTGSNSDLLSSEFAAVLTGRHLQLSINPLSFAEFLGFRNIAIESNNFWLLKKKTVLANAVQEYLKTGGFPKVVLTADELLRKELLIQYFNDILTKDIVERYKVKDVDKLKNLVLFYYTNFTRGYTFNKVNKVADFALSVDSIQRFSHYLENSFMIYFLPRFSYSLKNQMQAQRKVYVADNGMHSAIAFKFSEDKGKLLENAVFLHLKSCRKGVYYFSEKKEVDFVCKEGLEIKELINVCYNLEDKETSMREITALKEGMQYFKLKESKIIVAEGDEQIFSEQGFTINVIPFYKWALEKNI